MRKVFPVCCASAEMQSPKSVAPSVRPKLVFFMHSSVKSQKRRELDRLATFHFCAKTAFTSMISGRAVSAVSTSTMSFP